MTQAHDPKHPLDVLANAVEEVCGEVVVADVAGVEGEGAVGVPALGRGRCNLTVLDNLSIVNVGGQKCDRRIL